MDLNKSNMKKIGLLIAFGIALYMLLKNLYLASNLLGMIFGIVGPVLTGFALAFILNVLMVQFETRIFSLFNRHCKKIWPKLRRAVSIFSSLVVILGVIALILLIIIPELGRTITSLASNIPSYFNQLQDYFNTFNKDHPEFAGYVKTINIDWTNISQMIAQNAQQLAGSFVSSTVTITTNIFHFAISCVLTFVIALNVLAQKEKLYNQVKKVMYSYIPHKHADSVYHIFHLSYCAFYNCIAGTCTEACILGSLCFIGMNIFRFPYALLISVFVAFMALIPILGAFFSTVIGALLIFTVNPIQGLWYIVFFVVLQQLEGNLIYPRVVGSRVGLPGLWVLVAVTIGGNAFGVVGMILSVPVCSVLYTLLRENVTKRLNHFKHYEESAQDKQP